MSQLPQGWKLKKFTDVFDINGGTQPPKSEFISEPREGYIRLLQIRDFGAKPVPTYIPDNGKRRTCTEQDILIGRYGASVGRICTGMSGAYNVALARVAKPDYIDTGYLKYFLKSDIFQRPLSMLSRSAQNGFNKKDLSTFDFYQPPQVEQQRIAEKLDSVLTKVEQAQARLDKIPTILKRFRQSVLAAATSGELTKDWRKENDVEGWLPIKVGKIVEKIEAGKNIKCQERPPEENEFGIIKISAVTWGIYNEDQSKTLNDNSLFLENRRVKVGDFLISRANTLELLGMPVIVHQVTKNLMLSDKVLRLVMDEVNNIWLNIFLRSPLGRKEIESRATGNQQSMRNIGQKALLDIDLQLPSEPEKLEIVRCVSELLSNAGLVEKKYQAAKLHVDKMTQSILARAFSGKLFSPISEDEREDVEVNSQPKQAKPDSAKAAQVREKDVADKSDAVPESKVVSSPAIENHSEQTGEVFELLKSKNKDMSAQSLFDALSDNTFNAIDDLFSELKSLIEQKVVIQTGEGESSTFKVTKK